MSDHNVPGDARRYTITIFIAFVVAFVFTMLMMLWKGNYERDANGKLHYSTRVNEPSSSY